MSETDSPRKEGLLEEAAGWFARMRGPDAEANRQEFERWLARGALHRSAYNRAAEIFAMGKVLAEDPGADCADMVSQEERTPPLVFAGMAAVFACVITGAVLIMHPTVRHTLPASGITTQVAELNSIGEAQSIGLGDGSRIELASNSSLGVQFGANERRLMLEGGSARFFVAHERRPFIVDAAGGTVVAHGTIFDVNLSTNSHVSVHLVEGVIDVTTPSSNKSREPGSRKRLHAGDTISFAGLPNSGRAGDSAQTSRSSVGRTANRPPTNVAQAKEFNSVSLAQLIATANRGASRPIRLADQRTGELRISGKFRVDDTDMLAERLATLFDVTIDRSNPAEILITVR